MESAQTVITVTLNTALDRILEVPHFQVGQHARGRQISRYPAGKAINVSRALARLGRTSIATGFVGREELPAFEAFLKDTGPGRVVCQLLAVRGSTRENVTIIDPVHHTDSHIRDEGFSVLNSDVQRMVTKIGLLSRPNTIIVVSGSLPPGMDAQALNLLLNIAISGGAKIVLDLGGGLLHDLAGELMLYNRDEPLPTPGDTVAPPVLGDDPDGLLGGIWMVKPNLRELAEMVGAVELTEDTDILDAARRLARRIPWVVVTLGAGGAWLCHGGHVWRGWLDVDPTRIVNTVGSGDCMIAGMLDAYLSAGSPVDMLRRGMAVGVANALRFAIAEFEARQIHSMEERAHVEQRM